MTFRYLVSLFATAAVSLPICRGDVAQSFQENERWSQSAEPTEGGDVIPVLRARVEGAAEPTTLRSRGWIGDFVVRMEYRASAGASAGLLLHGRYELQLTDGADTEFAYQAAGGLDHARGEASTRLGARAPAERLRLDADAWHVVEARFRAPRFDDARNKVEDALLLEARIDGRLAQRNAILPGFTEDSEFHWEDSGGPVSVNLETGELAIRSFDLRRADFGAARLPGASGGETNASELVDLVGQGEGLFRGLGCVECHAIDEGGVAFKTGPSLYGVFRDEPVERPVMELAEGHRFTISADGAYLRRSLRDAAAELALTADGEPYLAAMPSYPAQLVSDSEVEAILAFLKTRNAFAAQGPVVHLIEEGKLESYDPMADRFHLLVDDRTRLQRGPMPGVSGRSIHVGQSNGINYSFDPRLMGFVQLWQGGFIDASGEFRNRGGQGLAFGHEARELPLGERDYLVMALDENGTRIDRWWKEPAMGDWEALERKLAEGLDFRERLAQETSRFLGYELDSRSPDAAPLFRVAIGEDEVGLSLQVSADGVASVLARLEEPASRPIRLAINESVFAGATARAGMLSEGIWRLPEGAQGDFLLWCKLAVSGAVWRPEPSGFDPDGQELEVEAAEARLPAGYAIESWLSPKDNYGRELLFEPLAMEQSADGTVVVASRVGGVWRLVDGRWELFAEGLFDCLGLVVEDERGREVVVGHKTGLTRLRDRDGDGRADVYESLWEGFGFHANYHEYLHGPVRGPDGSFFVSLNLSDGAHALYKGGGKVMGTPGGLRGWLMRIDGRTGVAEAWASGLRSPAGLGASPKGQLWYLDNQGDFVATSKAYLVEQGRFYGHPAGLVDLPGPGPESAAIHWLAVKASRARSAVLLPHNRLANSPGNPAWAGSDGRFGPFAGQLFVGDQMQSNLFRMGIEGEGATRLGWAVPFAEGLASGVMRPTFLDDGSLLLGQVGRGWQAKGGQVSSLQRIWKSGEGTPWAIRSVTPRARGFVVALTRPVASGADWREAVRVRSWTYRDAPDYGSPELGFREEALARVTLSGDRLRLGIELVDTDLPEEHPDQTGRVYEIRLNGRAIAGESVELGMTAFVTVHRFL